MREYLVEGIKKIGLEYTEEKIDNLIKYLEYLVEYNSHTNLTAIRDTKDAIEKHFLDSLLLQNLLNEKKGKKAIDIGTGAGFPGMVLAIFNPEIEFVLMDSVGKKTTFLQNVKELLELNNVTVVNSRAEDYITEENRESFDIGLCRGVNKLNVILEYMIPFIKIGGYFLAQKMSGTEEENEAENALNTLGARIITIHRYKLPNYGDERLVVEILKEKTTDKKYPRRAGVALKKPL
ncbi:MULTISPECIES: 16S rRNA (guanine(527)-N(7))-methyltransferase RsmG [Cetobacterium]|uniref:Ribosomal RNA small subunit methyltransferase G n=1 Tax=Candidatus Cetobacterium colombiensis TaxID=3073100 RepID=A0ABU4W9R1_9FUSO|nr:16S rRNA (guanine(527)-N(7))-methyltransferase RsmG [Candidatus Cetobacterium colombiensis]MDX8336267.1 16S rRNA (guanine(527)-N(7))-methyltransferase RsmG [Candidatus Cetobacterium colombiensis]